MEEIIKTIVVGVLTALAIILFFFIKWWDTPSFAPPHYFRTKEEAFVYLEDELVYNFIEIEKGGNQ